MQYDAVMFLHTFQHDMDMVLTGLKRDNCLDNVITPQKTFENHLRNLATVLERLSEAGLKIRPSKCSFCQLQVSVLGHVVSKDGQTELPTH